MILFSRIREGQHGVQESDLSASSGELHYLTHGFEWEILVG